MPRQAKAIDERLRGIRWWILALVWLSGLAAGLSAVLAAAAKYGCMSGDQATACTTSGSVLGIVLLGIVVTVVTVVTLATTNRAAGRLFVIGGVGVLAIAFCGLAAAGLLWTA